MNNPCNIRAESPGIAGIKGRNVGYVLSIVSTHELQDQPIELLAHFQHARVSHVELVVLGCGMKMLLQPVNFLL